jgi:putative membrane protein
MGVAFERRMPAAKAPSVKRAGLGFPFELEQTNWEAVLVAQSWIPKEPSMRWLRLVWLTLLAGIISSALAKTEKEFISDAIRGDNSEIALGQLATNKGSAESVRSFGQILVNDHSKHRNEAATLATQLGVLSSDEMTPEAQREIAKLQKLIGSEFDKEFVQLMVKDHEKDIDEFKEEAASGKGPVQQFASQSLPTLQEHLRIARNLELGKLGK